MRQKKSYNKQKEVIQWRGNFCQNNAPLEKIEDPACRKRSCLAGSLLHLAATNFIEDFTPEVVDDLVLKGEFQKFFVNKY